MRRFNTEKTRITKFHPESFPIFYTLGCPPSQDASDHQDYYVFFVGGAYKPGFATVTGRGDNPLYTNQMEVHVDGSELLGKKPVEILYLKPHAENVMLV